MSKFKSSLFDKMDTLDTKKPIKNKEKNASKFDPIFDKIGIDETYTQKDKHKFDKFSQNTYPVGGHNYMADILMLPTTSKGYRYILSVVDIYNKYFDIEKLKTKTAKETLDALLKIFKRKYLKSTNLVSMKTDNGGEFKKEFKAWMQNEDIAHLNSLPDRHSQLAPVENLNRQLGRLFMTYLTHKTMKLGKDYNEWDDIIDIVRTELNLMKAHPKDKDPFTEPMKPPNVTSHPKYKVDDIVYRPLEKPTGVYGVKFRQGDLRYDLIPRRIKKIFLYTNNWRYILNGFENVSYAENELKTATETEEKFEVENLRDKRRNKNKVEYLVKWKRPPVKQATWEPKENLIEDGLEDMINDFEESLKKKKRKR
jgi:hypothetical protein